MPGGTGEHSDSSVYRRTGAPLARIVQLVAQAHLANLAKWEPKLNAFQIVDDLLDVEGDPGILGKATAKDVAAGKKNFVSLLGVEGAQDRVRYLAAQAKQHLASFGSRASSLLHTVDFVLNRRH